MLKWKKLSASDLEIKPFSGAKEMYFIEKNNLADMSILDDMVGPESWQCTFLEIKSQLYCDISIYDKDKKEWVHKQGANFKDACYKWGIGREILQIPKFNLNIAPERVAKITYKNDKVMDLFIVDIKDNEIQLMDKGKFLQNTKNNPVLSPKSIEKPSNCEVSPPNAESTLSKNQINELLDLSKKLHGDNSALPLSQFMTALKCKTPYMIKSIYFEKMKKYIETWGDSSQPPKFEV